MISQRITNILSNILYDEEKPLDAPRKNGSFDFDLPSEIERKLFNILTHDSLVTAGKIQLIGLQNLRDKLGPSWPALEQNILASLQQIVLRRISTQDAFFSRNSEEHIIVFAQLSEEKAQMVCAKILQELTEKFLGQADTKDIVVQTAVGKIDGNLVFHATSLEQLLSSVAPALQRPPALQPFSRNRERENQALDIISDIERKYAVNYLPVWDSKHEVISTFGVSCRLNGATSKRKEGYPNVSRILRGNHLLTLDYYLFDCCRENLMEFHENNFRAIFCIPVSYETLISNERIKAYITLCATIPEHLQRYVTFAFCNFPAGIPAAKLRTLASMMNRFCRSVSLVCDDFIPQDIRHYKECGIKGLTVRLKYSERNAESYWQALDRMVAECLKHDMETTLFPVANDEELLLARQAGFKFICGPILSDRISTPGHMVRLSWKEFIAGKRPSF